MQSQSLEEGSEGMFMKDVAILNRFLLSVLFHIRKSCVCVVFVWLHEMFIERSAVHPLLPYTNTLWRTFSSILSAEVALRFEASSLGAILSLGNVSSLHQPLAY